MPTNGKSIQTGTISDTNTQDSDDGLFAIFSSSLQAEWVKSVSGTAYDEVSSLDTISGVSGYLLTGDTASWGAGDNDVMFGKLDKNGAIGNCPAIKTETSSIIEPDITSENASQTLISTPDPIDNGPFPVALTVTEQQYTINATPVDYPITVTDICSAAEPNPTGTISLSATQLDFGSVALKQTANLDMTITNSGDGTLKINTLSAPAKPFLKSTDSCSGKTISAGSNCKVSYKFSPTTNGNFTGTIAVNSNDPANSISNFVLKGTGGAIIPALAVQPLSSADIGIGKTITINGQGFTSKKNKVQFGSKATTIVSCSDSTIVIKLPIVKAGSYPLTVLTKNNGTISAGIVNLHKPEPSAIDISTGSKNTQVTVTGQYFRVTKPLVYLVSGTKRNAAAVLSSKNYDTSLKIKIPKLAKAGSYQILVSNSAGKSSNLLTFNYQ